MTRTVLIAEDEANIRSAIREYLQADGWEVLEARNGLEARDLLQQTAVDVLVSDIRMPGLDGHGLLAWVQKDGPGLPVLLITAHGDVDEAVQALQQGAADYMLKPFDLSELSQRLERCLLMQSQQRARRLEPQVLDDSWYLPAEGALKPVLDMAGRAAPTDATVLVSGESGTGKEVVARYIHVNSKRRDGPFVPVNAGAIPESLIESELFGHEKGAFSGAAIEAAKHGRFVGDLARTYLFSRYAEALPWGFERIKTQLDPFTGCFITRRCWTVIVLRLIFTCTQTLLAEGEGPAAALFDLARERLSTLLDADTGMVMSVDERYWQEKAAWDLYYDALDRAEQQPEVKLAGLSLAKNCRVD